MNPPRPWPKVLVGDDGIRPAGRPDTCFYCDRKIGEEHTRMCVVIRKKVRVRYSFDLEIEMPHSFTRDNIDFSRNEGGWCAQNAFAELAIAFPDGTCPCDSFNCEVLDENMDGEPIQDPPRAALDGPKLRKTALRWFRSHNHVHWRTCQRCKGAFPGLLACIRCAGSGQECFVNGRLV